MAPRFVAIDGQIGAGKSTFLQELAARAIDGVVVATEPLANFQFDSGNLLTEFYANPSKYAFAMQVCCFSWRADLLDHLRKTNPDARVIVVERSALSDDVFARANMKQGSMTALEYQIYRRYVNAKAWSHAAVDKVLYLDCDVRVCADRIAHRNRGGEAGKISQDYLEVLEASYFEWLSELEDVGVAVKRVSCQQINGGVKVAEGAWPAEVVEIVGRTGMVVLNRTSAEIVEDSIAFVTA